MSTTAGTYVRDGGVLVLRGPRECGGGVEVLLARDLVCWRTYLTVSAHGLTHGHELRTGPVWSAAYLKRVEGDSANAAYADRIERLVRQIAGDLIPPVAGEM